MPALIFSSAASSQKANTSACGLVANSCAGRYERPDFTIGAAIAQDVDQLQAFPVIDPESCHFVRLSRGKRPDMSKP